MKQIFGRSAQEFDAGGAVEPRLETIAGKKYRHAIVNAAGKFISFRHDHCAGEQRLAARDVVPFIPKASDRKHTGVRSAEVVGLLRAVDRSPLVVTRCRNNAPSAFESRAKHRLLGDGFAPGVKGGRNVLESFLPPARGRDVNALNGFFPLELSGEVGTWVAYISGLALGLKLRRSRALDGIDSDHCSRSALFPHRV